jgi:hypothetical protein
MVTKPGIGDISLLNQCKEIMVCALLLKLRQAGMLVSEFTTYVDSFWTNR